MKDAQCAGTESTQLLSAESNSVTRFCSQFSFVFRSLFLTGEYYERYEIARGRLHACQLTKVLKHVPTIRLSFSTEMKNDILDGFPGGCLNRFSGSGWSQYSSSQSTGKSTSMLRPEKMKFVRPPYTTVTGKYSLVVLNGAWTSQI